MQFLLKYANIEADTIAYCTFSHSISLIEALSTHFEILTNYSGSYNSNRLHILNKLKRSGGQLASYFQLTIGLLAKGECALTMKWTLMHTKVDN